MEILEDPVWQMSYGERAAMEGLLAQTSPALAIEIGTAEGGSLQRIAAHSDEVHSFDLVEPQLPLSDLPNVTLHTGDSHKQLPSFLAELDELGRNVDFVLVDGDHSSDGVRRDVEDVLSASCIGRTVMLIHDTTNEQVRSGLDDVDYTSYPKVAHVDLDFVAGYMFSEQRLRHELWGGLGLVVVDAGRPAYFRPGVVQDRYYPAAPLWAEIRDAVVLREANGAGPAADPGELEAALAEARHTVAHHEHVIQGLTSSMSWRVTKPLRLAKDRLRRYRARP